MLTATALCKRFGAKVLFDRLDWQIGRGERIGLVGDNGAGKTTLLRLLAGELEADDGRVACTRGETLAYLPQEVPRQEGGSIRQRVKSGHAELVGLEGDIERVTEALSRASAARAVDLTEQLTAAHLQYSQAGGDAFAGRVESILLGLGFSREQLDAPVASLSGGWAMRVELARLLVATPDFLLMDEPTNHLDAQSLAWLEQFLRDYAGTWVVVSHDHAFLDRTVDRVAALLGAELVCVPGTYQDFCEVRASFEAQQAAAGAKVARQAAHLRAFIDRFGAKASKARQAKSKARALEKLEATPRHAPARESQIRMRMRVERASGKRVLDVQGLRYGYGERPLYRDVDLQLERGQRIGIVGDNGAGKTTLLRLLSGDLAPQAGQVVRGAGTQIYLFDQHQSDALDGDATVLETLSAVMVGQPIATIRGLLGSFLFDAHACDRHVRHLSGGEKSRLALAKMVASPANCLLLDEPTNHLDAKSRSVLEQALRDYDGTLVLISHEREFLTGLVDRFWWVRKGGAVEQTFAPPPVDEGGAGNAAEAPAAKSSGDTRRAGKEAARAARQAKQRVAQLEAEVAAAESRLAAIDRQLVSPEIFNDASQSRALLDERRELEEHVLPARMAAWEEAAEAAPEA